MSAKKGRVDVDGERCKACYLCVRACPVKALTAGKTANSAGVYPVVSAAETCVACGNCHTVCPDVAITVWSL